MRSVRITNQMRQEIRNNAGRSFEAANKKVKAHPELSNRVRTAVMGIRDFVLRDKILGVVEEHVQKGAIPKQNSSSGEVLHEFFDDMAKGSVDAVRVSMVFTPTPEQRVAIGYDDDSPNQVAFDTLISLATPLNIPFGRRLVRRKGWNREAVYNVNASQFVGEDRNWIEAELSKAWVAERARYRKKERFMSDVNKLVGGTNSTRQMLERLPAAEAWFPQWVIEKMHEDAPKRASKTSQDIKIDETLLKTTTLTARLLSKGQDSA